MADNKNLEKKDSKKDKKPGLGKKISKFFREYKSELKKISWPTLPEVIKNSLVTIAVVAIVGIFIWGVDAALTFGREAILKTDETVIDQGTQDENASDTEIAEKIDYYGLKVEKVSATDALLSGTDISATDVYVVTEKGEKVAGLVAATEIEANAMRSSYAATLPAITVSNTDSSVSSTDPASPADAE